MKMKSAFLVFGLMACLCWASPASAQYLGNYCWTFSNSNGEAGILRAGVQNLGDSHYLLLGTMTVTSPLYFQAPAQANAEVIGGGLQLTVVYASRSSGWPVSYVSHGTLNSTTLSGDYATGYTMMTPTNLYFGATTGTVTHVSCP